ncbi:DNA-binding protein [Paenibacillus marinisediminis]
MLALIIIALIVWAAAATYYALHRPEPLEQLHLTDHYVHDEEVDRWLEREGFEIIGGKYYIPLHFRVDTEEERVSRLWVDCMVTRDEEWYPVRIVRERMELDWSAAGLRKLWAAYRMALPESDGIVIVNQAERSVRVVRIDIGEPETAAE